jgi:hypothetical protein
VNIHRLVTSLLVSVLWEMFSFAWSLIAPPPTGPPQIGLVIDSTHGPHVILVLLLTVRVQAINIASISLAPSRTAPSSLLTEPRLDRYVGWADFGIDNGSLRLGGVA